MTFKVICWKWKPEKAYRSLFEGVHVNILRNMVARNFKRPHEFICITDDATGIDPAIRIIPLWADFAEVPSPHGAGNPACYRRLKAFSREAAEIIGPRFVSLDLDCVIVADMIPVWDRPDDFVIWGDTALRTPYNGSMFMLTAGARAKVWETFHPVRSPLHGRRLNYVGSDQAWIAACLGPREKKWGQLDGVYSYRNEIRPRGGILPKDARVVFFHGKHDPWDAPIYDHLKWVRDHYR